ncbi:DNA-directed RNA polymerase subunit beta [Candidatus Lokiarchaeum ossiferum]|uniref:DNA-directed RNA polymerase subunit beta n=1 Tax=Candidatus Lokiarchaeum ossiferum TaxID=2951803 RepID=A0ABY6HSL7_9ARCH|nr:DNA-directed RNA polymerase subunit beta [Candidatus Lokiarchaeum sp. B-35]
MTMSITNTHLSGISPEDKWHLLNAYFKEIGLVRQHLDSFNVFLEETLQQICDETKKIIPDIPDFYIIFGRITVEEPQVREADGATKSVTPLEARIRELTYASKIYLEMTPVTIDERTQRPHYNETINTYIGKLPIMLKSSKCPLSQMHTAEELIQIGEDPLDPGGYFIINGTERALVTQEDLAPNRILIEEASRSSSATHIAKVFSTTHGFRAPVTIERRKDGNIRVSLPSVPGKIPIAILMRALGLGSDKKIFEAISDNPEIQKELIPIVDVAAAIEVSSDPEKSQMNALDYVGKRVAVGQTREYRIKRAQQILDRYLLPHIGYEREDRIKKAYFLGQMTQKVLELSLDIRRPDDKDHYSNKRLKLAGDLFTSLFRVSFLNLSRDIKYQLERTAVRGRKPNIKTAVRADVITERIRHALATGNWVGGKAGVSQLLDRTNYISTLSHLRRIISPLSRSQPHFEARDLHPTQWGKICPAETPEGPNCGLVKNLALTALISVGTNEKKIETDLYDLGVIPLEEVEEVSGKAKIYLNGKLLGIHPNYKPLVETIRMKRRRGDLSSNVNIAFYEDSNEVQINCDAGRARRPLLVVKNGKLMMTKDDITRVERGEETWNDLIARGLIEYFDAEEEENAFIAMKEEYITMEHTHLEVAPAAILGITASLIPFPDHNQSPRNTYEAGMAKQALGIFAANFHLRLDTRGHLLHYPQQPLTTTRAMDIVGFATRPAGQNFVLGIMSFQAFNIEDALIMNKASVERGLARSTFFRTYEGEERKYPGGQLDKFEVPEKEVRGYRASEAYRHLAHDGIVEPETICKGGDVLIGRTSPPRFTHPYDDFDDLSQPQRRETSINMRHSENGTVDTVIITETLDGNKLIKIKVRDLRIPELGDKFASRHGQKGVLGLICPQEDMPFSAEGIVPDLVINPHAMPSRMTLGQMFEGCLGKVAAATGTIGNATPFEMEDMDILQQQLVDNNFDYGGRETLYNGVTGVKYDVAIYFACVYYQKLHHLVADKIHARARGPVQILTRQPTEGRAREGGLRFGEMERDCLVGHGSSVLLKERLLDESDRTTILICEKCGLLGTYDRNRDRSYCPVCGEKSLISTVTCSYAFKLLLQEMMSLGLAPRLLLRDRA